MTGIETGTGKIDLRSVKDYSLYLLNIFSRLSFLNSMYVGFPDGVALGTSQENKSAARLCISFSVSGVPGLMACCHATERSRISLLEYLS